MLSEETKQRALRILERRDVSRKELITKLTDKGVSLEEAAAAADWLEALGVIDDARYAGIVVRHYMSKGYGKARIQNELYRHGLARDLWEEALAQYQEPPAARQTEKRQPGPGGAETGHRCVTAPGLFLAGDQRRERACPG